MQLKEIMTRSVETVAPEMFLVEAAKKMLSRDIGWLPVLENRQVVGIITDRDMAIRVIAAGLDSQQTKVQDVMTREVFSCSSDGKVEDACDVMEQNQVRRLVVMDTKRAMVGIVSLADIALQLRDEQSGKVLKEVSQPS